MATHTSAGGRARKARPMTPREHAVTGAMDAFRRIVRDLRRSARAAEQRVGISGAQLFVLQQLSEAAPQSVNDLADRTHTDQSSVSVVVSRLVKRRLVTRARARDDGRRVELDVTASGRALLRRAPAMAQRRLFEALERLPLADVRALSATLTRVCSEMDVEEPAGLLFDDDERSAGRGRPPRRSATRAPRVADRAAARARA